MRHGAEVTGDGLLIPRVTTETRLMEPLFDGMGALVGPGLTPDKLSIAVTAKRRELTFVLDHDYNAATPGLTGIRLEESNLVADQGAQGGHDPAEYRTQRPLEAA